MDWDEQVAQLTDAEFPETKAYIRLIDARILLLISDAELTASEREKDVTGILWNAHVTAGTSYELWRRGLLLQTGILLRNVVEASAFAVLLHREPARLEQYRAGKVSSTRSISFAARILGPNGPDITRFWGQLSKHFIHIGPLHRQLLTWHIDLRKDRLPLQIVLLDIKLTYYLLEVCAEFCFFEKAAQPRYWQSVNRVLHFQPTSEAERELSLFMEQGIDEVQKAMQTNP